MAAKLNPNPKGYNVYLFECLQYGHTLREMIRKRQARIILFETDNLHLPVEGTTLTANRSAAPLTLILQILIDSLF